MAGGGWRLSLLRPVAGVSALLLAACEHGPPAFEHGTVLAASGAHQAAENTGAGAGAGAVIGGTIGGLIGAGKAGAVLGATIGVAAGAIGGSAAEGAAQPTDGVSYTVRLDDGRVVTIVQHLNAHDVIMQPGSRVRITTEGPIQRVTSDPA